MKLLNSSKNLMVVENLQKADQMWARMKGLLGRKSLSNSEGLWITKCFSIHTFFMQMSIDAVFVDRSLKVKACFENVRPWRLIWPVVSADSVFEFSIGTINRGKIEIGDQLDVVH